jgi:hypothetical protein
MKTIAEFVQQGIDSLSDLQAALQTAMQLEFATIPPYLCAEWSINHDHDPDGVADTINVIVKQEMFHFALAGNMLAAIGGTPAIANPGFILGYPTNALPGGIPQRLAVDLKALSVDQLQVFLQIEYPEFPPVALAPETTPATIGSFYDTVLAGFTAVNPTIVANAHNVRLGEVFPIASVTDAQAAIALIKGEGEGAEGSPDQPVPKNGRFAHYYAFKEISTGHRLEQNAGKWSFNGASVRFPAVFDLKPASERPAQSTAFSIALSQLLIDLQKCWITGAKPDIAAMFQLQKLGQGIRPEFRWSDPANS